MVEKEPLPQPDEGAPEPEIALDQSEVEEDKDREEVIQAYQAAFQERNCKLAPHGGSVVN